MTEGTSSDVGGGTVPPQKDATVHKSDPHKRLVWLDLEMTGLDVASEKILEVAVVVTDGNLATMSTFTGVCHHDDEVLDAMGEWCTRQHATRSVVTGRSLIDDVRASLLDVGTIEVALCEFLRQFRVPGTHLTLAGSSVSLDRQFLAVHMPRAAEFFHYRIFDVSSFMEASRRWAPSLGSFLPRRTADHRALGDTLESINLMRFLRANFLRPDFSGGTKPSAPLVRVQTAPVAAPQTWAPPPQRFVRGSFPLGTGWPRPAGRASDAPSWRSV